MPDLFDIGDEYDKIASTPDRFGRMPRTRKFTQVLPNTGYDPSAGQSSIQDMPNRSMYDTGLMEGQNIDDYRSDKQGFWPLTGAFLGRVVGQGLAKTAEGFSMLGSAIGAGVAGTIDATGLDNLFGTEMDDKYHSMDSIVNNPVNKLFFDLEDKVKELMPVYHSSDWVERSVSNKFFHNFGEWMADQGADGVAFALSAIIPSAAISKIGVGVSILADASRGATALGKFLGMAGASENVLNAASKGVSLAAQYGVQTSSEALFEAKDTGDQMYRKYLSQINEGRPDYAQYKSVNDLPTNLQADIKEKVAGAMKNDYWWNMIALAPSNLFEIGLINKFLGKAESRAIRGIGAEISAGENIAEDAAKATSEAFQGIGSGKFKRLSKNIYDAGKRIGETRVGAGLKVIPEAMVAEGLYEENIQNQISDMSQQYGLEGKSGYFLESGFNAAKQAIEAITPSHLNDPKYKDTRESIFAGAVIGALFGGGAGATLEFNHERASKQKREAVSSRAIDFLNSAKSDFLKQDLYETVNTPQPDGSTKKEIVYDEDGNPIVNKPAVANFLGNQNRMADLVTTEEYYSVTGQKEMAKIIRDERTTNWALSHMQAGKADAMFSKLDDLAKAKDSDLQSLGFDPSYYGDSGSSVPVIQRVEEVRQKAAKVKQYYEDAIRSVPIEQSSRIEELVRLRSRIDAMNTQVDGLVAQRDEVSLEYRNDSDHVKQIDQEARKLRALEENKAYLEERAAQIENNPSDTARLEASKQYHDNQIAQSKAKIDSLKSTYKDQLDLAGYDSTIGKYNFLKNAGGRNSQGRSQNIKDAENRIVQLNGAIQEHQQEYDLLVSPYDGAVHYRNRLGSSFRQQEDNLGVEEARNNQDELPASEHEPTPQPLIPAVNEQGEIVPIPQPPTQPEIVHTDPNTLTQSMELPQSSTNQLDIIKETVLTGGRFDQTKADKFASDNLGKTLKVTYEGNDAGVFGVIKQGSQGNIVFVQDNGREMSIERLLGGKIKSITPIFKQATTISRTEQASVTKESPIVTEAKQKAFTSTMYNSSKPYLAIGLNSTTGIDNSTPDQERWFRTTENLDLNDGKYQLVTVTQKNQQAAKAMLGSDWNDNLLYDDTTIKVVLLKDAKPVRSDQFGVQREEGEIVYTALNLTPNKDSIGVVEYKSFADIKYKEYTHQVDKKAKFIVTEQEIKDGTVDRLLQAHREWRDTVLADPNTKIIDVTSKGSGIRIRGDLGAVQGRLTEGQIVDVKIAKGESVSDPSGKSITVRPGLTYAEYKGMVVPLTGRVLTKSEQGVIKSILSKWSQLASQGTINRLIVQLSNALDSKNREQILDLKNKLANIDPTLVINKSLSPDELIALDDIALAMTTERNELKTYLEDMIRFGSTDANSIYIENGNFIFDGKALSQENLWSGSNTEELDKFLSDKYLQISSRALATTKPFTEFTESGERKWKSYNEYLTSTEYPDETIRAEVDIPLRTSLAPIGEAQFSSVNLRFNGLTDAIQPIRTDTQAYKKIADGTQQQDKFSKRKEISFDKVLESVKEFTDGQSIRVELRLRDKSQGQEPFYIDYNIVNGQLEFSQLTKRDGSISNIEPKSFQIVREELNSGDSSVRPELYYEYMNVSEASSPIIESVGESVEPDDFQEAPDNPYESPDIMSEVINYLAQKGDFIGSRNELDEFVSSVLESIPDATAKQIGDAFLANNPTAIQAKVTNPTPQIKRRTFRGMTSDNRLSKPIDLNKEEAWFRERFPDIDVNRVNGLIQGKYWGLFDSAAGVLLSTDAVEGTAYHEAFHVASLLYHDETSRQGLYKEYRDRTGDISSDYEVEEQLAEQFRDYVLSDGNYQFPDKQNSFFQKLWDAIKSFLGISNQQNIEEVFNKINNGGYANLNISDNLGLQLSAPMKADLAESFTRTHALLEDMTVSFFDHFFSSGNNIDTLFNVFSEGKQSILVDDIYRDMLEEYRERAKDGGLVATFENPGKWEEMVKLHKQELANLGLKLIDKVSTDNTASEENFDTNLETEGQKDNAQMESHIESSSKEGMSKIVKFFLSSLPELEREEDGSLVRVPSAYFTDKVANPEKIMNILGNQLAGMTDISQMVARIKELSEDFPSLIGLLSRMQIGDEILPTTATPNEARFQTLFWQQFAKANHDYYMTFLRDDGGVTILDSTSETQQSVTRELWRTNLIQQLNDSNAVIRIEDNRLVLDKNKVQQLKSIADPFDRAAKLGIQFTFPNKIKKSPLLFKEFRENLDAIIATIVSTKQPVTDLYTREGLNAQNRIRNIANIEAVTNPDSIERQHIGMDNKTLYSLTLNNSLSLAIQELNSQQGDWFDAVSTSSYSQNSVVLSKIKEGESISISINEGIKRQTADGQETAKLTPADALANMINGIVNGYYSILRPGDKKLEYKLNFGEFIESKGLITREGNYNSKVNKIFRGYLQDEFNRVFALKDGYGSNIKEFNKHNLLENGRLDLGIFNDILKDVQMPVINSVADASVWIEDNKDVVDANIKKFLESTTNQYGANARKLSVFRETMNKTGKRTYVPTGEYMLNGIDNSVVNGVLGRDLGDNIYSKNDIHQFFRYVTVNQLIGNIEQTKLTTGAIEFYKDPLKRFSALTGTKKMVRVDPAYQNWVVANMPKVGYINGQKVALTQDTNVRVVTTGDLIATLPKEQLDNYREGLKANGLNGDQIDVILGKMQNINEADAQSWMHLPAYRELLDRTGDWTNAHEAAYTKAIKGQTLTTNEIFLFPPLKPQAFGPQQSANLHSPILIKTSISPLIPSVVKGTDLEKLMHKMYKSDVDMVSTESAIKVGGKVDTNTDNFVPLYENIGGVAEINQDSYTKDIISVLPAQYMGIQLDIAPIRKTSTTRGTQQEKIIMSNILNIPEGQEIVTQYKDVIGKLVSLAKSDMLERLGVKAKGDNYIIPDRTKLLDYLEEQSIQRGVPTNTLLGLREALTNGSTLDAVVNKDRIDSILASIITDGAIKGKRNGEQRVQIAITGYGNRVFEGDKLLTSDKLAPYVYDPTGTKPMEIMTALPKALVPFAEKVGGLAKFNQMIAEGKIDERILKGTGFRIPTQQLSSMVYYRIKEFLPYESGPIVVLPSVITTIAGSDFDIDKLSMYEKNYKIHYEGISVDFRPSLRRELTNAGLIDQFKTAMDKLPEQLTDEEISDLVQYSKDAVSEDEADKMDDIILEMQRKYTTKPSLRYIESDGDTRQSLENKLLELHERVLSHPSNFKNLIAPIGNEVLSGLAQEMVSLRSSATIGKFNDFEVSEANPYPSAELMNMNYLLEQGQRFQAGKDLLGIAAKQNTHHILSQLAHLSLKPDVKVWFKETEGQGLRLDHTTDLVGKHQISDIISEFINGFVDIVKDQFTFDLNANDETINPFFYLIRVGVPIESVTSFLNQPVIRRFIEERNTQNSLIAKGLPDAYRKSRYQTIDGIRAELVSIAKKEPSLYAKWKKFDGQMPHSYKNAEARDKVRATYYNFTKDQLDKMILDPNSPQNAYRQLQVLDQFLQYQEDGAQLTNLMMLNSQDTDGIKKSLARSYVEQVMYNEFVKDKSTIFSNPESVVNEGLIRPYFDIVMEGERYFAPLFDSKSEKSNTLRHEFAHQIKDMGVNDATDSMKRFENHLIAHLLQNITTEQFPISLSDEALKNTVTTKLDGTISVAPALLLGSDSAVNSLIKFRKNLEFPNDFINNLFGIRGIDRTIGNYVDTVRMFTKRINKQQADILAGAASDLLNSNPELAKRIFRTTLAQSGLNNSYMSYHNLLPAKFFHNFVRNILDVYRTQDVPLDNVIDDYYRNNWKNNTLVPSIENRALRKHGDTASIDINNRRYRSNLYIKNWALPDGMTRDEFNKRRSNESLTDEEKPKWELYLYKYIDNDGDRVLYKRVNPLGLSERFQETSLSWKERSALNSNNNVDGEFVSSENYNSFTSYKPDLGNNNPDNIIVSNELKNRLKDAALARYTPKAEFNSIAEQQAQESTISAMTQAYNNAIDLYKQKVAEGMSEEQAEKLAEHKITCE